MRNYLAKLSHCDFCKHFLRKSYSLELLLLLRDHNEIEGIEEIYTSLKSAVPKYPAFLNYLDFLESRNCIVRYQSQHKKSRKCVTLSKACRDAIDAIDANFLRRSEGVD